MGDKYEENDRLKRALKLFSERSKQEREGYRAYEREKSDRCVANKRGNTFERMTRNARRYMRSYVVKPSLLQAGELGGSFTLLGKRRFKYLIDTVREDGRDEMR